MQLVSLTAEQVAALPRAGFALVSVAMKERLSGRPEWRANAAADLDRATDLRATLADLPDGPAVIVCNPATPGGLGLEEVEQALAEVFGEAFPLPAVISAALERHRAALTAAGVGFLEVSE